MEYVKWAKRFQFWYRILAYRVSTYVKPEKVVDIGCGPGIVMEELKKIFPEALIVGVDLNSEMCKISKALCCDAKNLPFKDETFDLTIFCYSLHETGISAIYEAKRVLKNGGVLAIRDIRAEMPKITRDFILYQLSLNVGKDYAKKVEKHMDSFPNSELIRNIVGQEFDVLHYSNTIFDFDLIARKSKI